MPSRDQTAAGRPAHLFTAFALTQPRLHQGIPLPMGEGTRVRAPALDHLAEGYRPSPKPGCAGASLSRWERERG